MQRALAHDEIVVTLNPQNTCEECHLAAEYRGYAGFAHRLQHGDKTYGILAVSTSAAYAYDTEEQVLFSEVAGDLAFALHKIEAAQQLHASRTMLARTERIAHIGSWEWDIAADQVRWSAELFRIFQRDPAVGAPAFAQQSSLYVTEDLHRLQQTVERCVTNGTPYELELRIIRTDGEMRYCIARGQAEADDEGQIHRLVGSLQDITGRRQAETALWESEEKYSALFNQSVLGIYVHDLEGNIVDVNQMACLQSGYSRDELLHLTIFDLHPTTAQTTNLPKDEILRQWKKWQPGKSYTLEAEHQRKDGTIYPIAISTGVIRYTNGHYIQALVQDITERQQSERQLLHYHELMQYIITHNRSAVAVHDRELRYIYVSQRYLDDYHVQEKDVIGKHHYEVFPDLPQKWRDVHQKALQGEICSAEDDPYEREDGTVDWTRWECRPWYEADGTIGGIIIYTEVITAQKQMELALRQERDLSRALADAAAAVSSTLDPDEVLDRLLAQVSQIVPNDTANIMLIENEQQVRAVRGRNYDRLGNADAITAPAQAFDQVPNLRQMAKSGAPLIIDDTATDPQWLHTGKHTWIRSYVGAPICARGATIGFLNLNSATPRAFTPLHADILRAFADHAAIALENAHIAHDLRQSEQRYRRLFERSNDAIFLIDRRTGRYQAANAAAEILTGRTLTELQQLTTRDVTPEGVEERLKRAATVQQAFKIGEVQYLRPDGIIREALLDVVPLDDHMAFGIARDITEQKEIEKHLRRQEQLAAIGQLAAGIAHDFRNLLTTIILYAQLGQRKTDLSPTVAHYLEIINGEAHKATDLVQQILDFSRRTEIERQPLDLVDFVSNVVGVLQRALPENIRITLNVLSGPCIVEGDAGRLQQALTNLALNARDAMPEGGILHLSITRIAVTPGAAPPLRAMAEALAPPAWIHLSVADTGPGMSEEAYAHLFEPFFTTKAEDQGTGLGLAQVYGIIQLHNGYIDVQNAVGAVEHGVTFHIYLPASTRETEEATATMPGAPSGQGEIILLVEDNARLRGAGQNILTALGYQVLTAANGHEALALYQAESNRGILPHLLITDLVMPEMGGKALLQALRRYSPNLKAIVMTGYTAEESEQTLQASGFLEVIRKPFDADSLARAIRRALKAQ